MKEFCVVMAHGSPECREAVQRHLPFWRQHGAPILFLSPANKPLIVPGCQALTYGLAGHHGPESITRFKYLLRHLLEVAASYDRVVIFEYDSFCVSKIIPEVPADKLGANAFFNRDSDPRMTEKMYTHPPLILSLKVLEKLVSKMDELPLEAGAFFWDRWMGKLADVAGVEIHSFVESENPIGLSRNTIEPTMLFEVMTPIRRGVRLFHGVKTAEIFDLIVQLSPWTGPEFLRLKTTKATKRNFISFSLWGDNVKYTIGAIENVNLAKIHYPNWVCRFYMPESEIGSPTFIVLSEAAEVKIIPAWLKDKMFARYLCADDPSCDRVIFRDCDSRLSAREAAAVNEWITAGTIFSTLRDHPAHARNVNGGLCGIRGGYVKMTAEIQSYWQNHAGAYSGLDQDQNFLCRYLWPKIKNSVTQHDSHSAKHYPGSVPFPTPREGWRFCGEVIEIVDGKENFRAHDWPQLQDVSDEARKKAIADAVFAPII